VLCHGFTGSSLDFSLQVDTLPADRRDQLQRHVTEIAQRDAGDEIGGLAKVAAGIRSKVHVRYPHPLPDA
jgi:hypothetical protein